MNLKPCVSWTAQKLLEWTTSVLVFSGFVQSLYPPPILHLFQSCLQSCASPNEWKIHKIVPILKGPDKSSIQNYHPISLLCVLLKVLESIIYKKIIDFIQPQLAKEQFGFIRNCSCTSQLLCLFHNIMNSVDSKAACDVISLDICEALDSIPHSELLFKLWTFGITGNL